MNLIHYNTDTPEHLLAELRELTELGGPHLDGFQLNVAWPSIEQLTDYLGFHPEAYIVLQIRHRAMAEMDESPEKLADMVKQYDGIAEAVLIDSSGGKGEPFDCAKVIAYLRTILNRGYFIDLGVAGGLGPKTILSILPLLAEFPGLNIDAEGKLRTPKPEDALDMAATREYLERAFDICQSFSLA